jgi:hypothetical protein
MAFDPTPTSFFGAGFSADDTTHTITLNTSDAEAPDVAALAELSDAEADDGTGDWRKVLFALMEAVYANWIATDAADRPAKVRVFRGSSVNETTGVITRNYTVQIDTGVTGEEVVDE